ncbi:hypothetical protein EYR40_004642 [Pleurotus pulmonarius]|nr:hypothetical protein EYR38_001885 [Pleurotus pulmonarius]KAF4605851.1 hypothetical protein EYR40_004642 [Pleurotus pulmonarius]
MSVQLPILQVLISKSTENIMSLPPLPPHPTQASWSPGVYDAFNRIEFIYLAAHKLLGQEAEANRLRFHSERLIEDGVPILLAMEEHAMQEGIPLEWLHSITSSVGFLIAQLDRAHTTAVNHEDTNVVVPQPVSIVASGARGRPRKVIDPNFLHNALEGGRKISIAKLARLLNVSRQTLYTHLKEHNIHHEFNKLTNDELDTIVQKFREVRPTSGLRYLQGFLSQQGLRIQKTRISEALQRASGLGQKVKQQTVIKRRVYEVSRPNALWHIDGHHKLIHWGIVIFGVVDGYSRMITGLRASDNNRADTALSVFLEAVENNGQPSRVRGDRGRENKGIAVYMILTKGANRGSFIWGPSTRNTRVERLWVEIGTQFGQQWRAFFQRLEDQHQLDRHNPHHLWLIHVLFLDDINTDCQSFQATWNAHPIGGRGHDNSPNDLHLTGRLQHGEYHDDCDDIPPEEITAAYGVNSAETPSDPVQNDHLGHNSDEEADIEANGSDDEEQHTWSAFEETLGAEYAANFLPKTVAAPKAVSPFTENGGTVFAETLATIHRNHFLPQGFGIRPEEWSSSEYPGYENLRVGKRGKKDIFVALPDAIWRPRAEFWVQGLHTLQTMLYMGEA